MGFCSASLLLHGISFPGFTHFWSLLDVLSSLELLLPTFMQGACTGESLQHRWSCCGISTSRMHTEVGSQSYCQP